MRGRRPGARRLLATLLVLASVGAATFWGLTAPGSLPAGSVPAHVPDAARGEVLYRAGSCLACHRPPEGAPGLDQSLPSGGRPLVTPAGTFYPQNLTPDPRTGLGRFDEAGFVNAMTRGVSPEGTHYFPSFPYGSYRSMSARDLLDVRAYLLTLPAVRSPGRPQAVPLEPVARRAVGIWKRLASRAPVFSPDPARGPEWNRGAYLVKGPGHCGECHTPRNRLMVPDEARAMAGGPHPAGEGNVPSLLDLVARGRYRDAADLALALEHGETFGYDKLSSGGMAGIQESLSHLPEEDLRAMATYLVSLRATPGPAAP